MPEPEYNKPTSPPPVTTETIAFVGRTVLAGGLIHASFALDDPAQSTPQPPRSPSLIWADTMLRPTFGDQGLAEFSPSKQVAGAMRHVARAVSPRKRPVYVHVPPWPATPRTAGSCSQCFDDDADTGASPVCTLVALEFMPVSSPA